MKKIFVASFLVIIVFTSFSCKKILDKLFNGLDTKVPDITVAVPAIPVFAVGTEGALQPMTMNFNLDSVIRANTAGVFSIADVKSVKVKKIDINVPNGDAMNNLGNFESGRVTISSNSNSNTINMVSVTIPETAGNSYSFTPTDSPELLSYLRGSQVTYQLFSKARKPTTKPLTLVISITVRVE